MPERNARGSEKVGPPRVSVVIPCFNAARYVSDAVASVLEQGEPGIEIIVVNDGSSDGEALTRALRPYGSAVTRVDGPHEGLPAARNRGITAARGRWLAFLDADDRWKRGFLERQLSLLEESGADLVYCDAELFGPALAPGGTVMADHPSRGEVSLASVLAGDCVVVMSTVVADADAVRRVGGFDPALRFCEDLDLWARMLEAGARFTYHRDPLAQRRIHDANMSRDGMGMLAGASAVLERHAAALGASDRPRIARRIRDMRDALRVEAAKAAIRAGTPRAARAALWGAFRARRRWKLLVAALSVTLAPGPAMRYLRER
ncbi:MAG TPA: glycosyltransferase, partial [Longimicrobiales bacterium]|nr:glycosyltransferase [Longimicrobiales bacterium]